MDFDHLSLHFLESSDVDEDDNQKNLTLTHTYPGLQGRSCGALSQQSLNHDDCFRVNVWAMPGLSSSSLLNYGSLFVRGEKQVKRREELTPRLTTQKYKICGPPRWNDFAVNRWNRSCLISTCSQNFIP